MVLAAMPVPGFHPGYEHNSIKPMQDRKHFVIFKLMKVAVVLADRMERIGGLQAHDFVDQGAHRDQRLVGRDWHGEDQPRWPVSLERFYRRHGGLGKPSAPAPIAGRRLPAWTKGDSSRPAILANRPIRLSMRSAGSG